MLARVAAIEEDPARAGLLWGAVEQMEAADWELGDWPKVREEYAAPIRFDDERFRERRSEGRVMALDDVVRVVTQGAAAGNPDVSEVAPSGIGMILPAHGGGHECGDGSSCGSIV